jgi:hypothetical protein
MVVLPETETTGKGKTETAEIAAPVQPLAFVTRTVYEEAVVGLTLIEAED